MNTLTSAKSNYWLEVSLDYLHEESQEWLSELNFLKDEITFYINLMKNKHVKAIMEGKAKIYDNAFHAMVSFKNKVLVNLKSEVVDHEKYLANILKENKISNEADYRAQHKDIRTKIGAFQNNFKDTKKEFFIVMEDWS